MAVANIVSNESVISTNNSTTTPLGIGGVFTGTGEEVKDYGTISIFIYTDEVSATDGLSIEWSTDNTNWDDNDQFTIVADNGRFFTFGPEAQYFRLVYTNGGASQNVFRLQTIFHRGHMKPSSHRIGDSISIENDAELSKCVLSAKNELTNEFHDLLIDPSDHLLVTDASPSKTGAFGRSRVAEPFSLFDSSFMHTDGSLFWHTTTAGAGTSALNTDERVFNLTVGTASGDRVKRETYQNFPYQPGKSQLILMTGVLGESKANVRQRIGYFDDSDGLFFEQDGSNLKIVLRSSVTGSVVDTVVNQSLWNIDTMDGTGPSNITIDTTKSQIFVIDFQWLGVGKVRFGFGNSTSSASDAIIYVHQINNANNVTTTYMASGSLPLRYEIENTGTAGSTTTMKQICSNVSSEGGFNPLGILRSVDSGVATKGVIDAFLPLVSIRLKSTNSRAMAILKSVQSLVVNGNDILWRVYWNPALTGDSWSSVSSTAATEIDVAATSLTGGEVMASGYTTTDTISNFETNNALRLGISPAGTSDIITLAAYNTSGGTAQVFGTINYQEII